jgi:hypothetical protein
MLISASLPSEEDSEMNLPTGSQVRNDTNLSPVMLKFFQHLPSDLSFTGHLS